MQKERLLDIIVERRTEKKLDQILKTDKEYQAALKEQDKALERLENLKLKDRDMRIVSRVLDANNHGSALYGLNAYQLGLKDGGRLFWELLRSLRR